jgi:hypothetical protein
LREEIEILVGGLSVRFCNGAGGYCKTLLFSKVYSARLAKRIYKQLKRRGRALPVRRFFLPLRP